MHGNESVFKFSYFPSFLFFSAYRMAMSDLLIKLLLHICNVFYYISSYPLNVLHLPVDVQSALFCPSYTSTLHVSSPGTLLPSLLEVIGYESRIRRALNLGIMYVTEGGYFSSRNKIFIIDTTVRAVRACKQVRVSAETSYSYVF